jgi:hypothetical protein
VVEGVFKPKVLLSGRTLRRLRTIRCSTKFWAAYYCGQEWLEKVEQRTNEQVGVGSMACRVKVVTGRHAGSTSGDGERKGGGVGAELQEPLNLL